MKEEMKYFVIGGQYEDYCYGGTNTLYKAKQLARENNEYWDNWQGWHMPKIYKAEDTIEVESKGRITTLDGQRIRIHIGEPYLIWSRDKQKWIKNET